MTATANVVGVHRHRCMRCGEWFDCQTPALCKANEDVMPDIITLENGRPVMRPHCPDKPDWEWIRDYGNRCAADRQSRIKDWYAIEAVKAVIKAFSLDERFTENKGPALAMKRPSSPEND